MRIRLPALPIASILFAACSALCACGAKAPTDPAQPATSESGKPADFAYAELDINDLQARMQRGEFDSATLTRAYFDRIDAIDRAGPRLHSIITLSPNALSEAQALDAERKAGHVRGPLHGIPVLLKDNIDATPMATSAGSLALAGYHPQSDAFLVQRLRNAGAVILGKTNLSEWANFRSSRATSGWSARGGQTKNPYALDRSPCGSSAGSAVAVSANLGVAAIGTETDGSIICPAAINGVVGLKPTLGLVSRDGIVPISHAQDTAGPIARDVSDAALLLAAMAGIDAHDPATAQAGLKAVLDYHAHLNPDALQGARIGLLRDKVGMTPETAAAMESATKALRAAGASVVDARIPTEGQWDADETLALQYEFKHDLNRYLSTHAAPIKSLDELIAFDRHESAREMPLFGQDIFEQANAKGDLNDVTYIEARNRARRLAGPEGIDMALKAQHLDALIAPATGSAWKIDPLHGDDFPGAGYGAAAVAGYPSLTVPMGFGNGLPLGLVFIGSAWSEPRLIELGYAYEQRTLARKPPQYLPTLRK